MCDLWSTYIVSEDRRRFYLFTYFKKIHVIQTEGSTLRLVDVGERKVVMPG